jgi:hypothetical protein
MIRSAHLLILAGLLLIAAGVYYAKLVFSESLYIEKNSIEYYFLVPAIIKDIPLDSTDEVVSYYYSAADGNKPAVASVEFTTPKSANEVDDSIVSYFKGLGFVGSNNAYKKDSNEISITHSTSDAGEVLINVAVLEHI